MFSFRTLKKITIQITSVHVNVTNKKEKNHESNEIKITNFQFVFFFLLLSVFFSFLYQKPVIICIANVKIILETLQFKLIYTVFISHDKFLL